LKNNTSKNNYIFNANDPDVEAAGSNENYITENPLAMSAVK
jgi:hypothetical protein